MAEAILQTPAPGPTAERPSPTRPFQPTGDEAIPPKPRLIGVEDDKRRGEPATKASESADSLTSEANPAGRNEPGRELDEPDRNRPDQPHQNEPGRELDRDETEQRGVRLLIGAALALLVVAVGGGLVIARLAPADGGTPSPVMEVASSRGVSELPGLAVTYPISGTASLVPVSAAAAARELTTGMSSTPVTEVGSDRGEDGTGRRPLSTDPEGVRVGGELSFTDGRLTGVIDLPGASEELVRLRLSLVAEGRLLVSQEMMLPGGEDGSALALFWNGSDAATLPGSLTTAGDRISLDWDLRGQPAPTDWSGTDEEAARLILTVDSGPRPGTDAAFLRYQEDLGLLALGQSPNAAESSPTVEPVGNHRASSFAAADLDPETVECVLSTTTAEQEEAARFQREGLVTIALPCLLNTHFADSPTGVAATDGLAGFVPEPAAAVQCIAARLGGQLSTVDEYRAITSSDYTTWTPHVTDSYASVLEACVKLRPFYLDQFAQFDFQRSTCPTEMTDYVLTSYSWKVFITEGMLDTNPILRDESRAAFNRFVNDGYESIDCFVV